MTKILVVLTSKGEFKSGQPTGWYLPEFAHPYDVLAPKATIVVASPAGGAAPLDPGSIDFAKDDAVSVKFLNEKKDLWEKTTPLREFLGRAAEFDALFFPGGHGPMLDLATDADSIKLIQEFVAADKVVSAVCHGVGALLNVSIDGKPLLEGRQVTGFANSEEDAIKMSTVVPFSLEDSISKAGGNFSKADDIFGVKVITDGKLITGQNPASSKPIADAILKALGI